MHHSPAFLALVNAVLPRIRELTITDLSTLQKDLNNLLIIDVREDHEWQKGHIPGALHMGRGIIERDIEQRVPDKTTPLVLYCGGGYRSALATDNLQQMGYSNVYSLKGGWRDWCARSLPQGK